jgi:hypothetical protein
VALHVFEKCEKHWRFNTYQEHIIQRNMTLHCYGNGWQIYNLAWLHYINNNIAIVEYDSKKLHRGSVFSRNEQLVCMTAIFWCTVSVREQAMTEFFLRLFSMLVKRSQTL